MIKLNKKRIDALLKSYKVERKAVEKVIHSNKELRLLQRDFNSDFIHALYTLNERLIMNELNSNYFRKLVTPSDRLTLMRKVYEDIRYIETSLEFNAGNVHDFIKKEMALNNEKKNNKSVRNFKGVNNGVIKREPHAKFFKGSLKIKDQTYTDNYDKLDISSLYNFLAWFNLITLDAGLTLDINEMASQLESNNFNHNTYETVTFSIKFFKNGTVEVKFKNINDLKTLKKIYQ